MLTSGVYGQKTQFPLFCLSYWFLKRTPYEFAPGFFVSPSPDISFTVNNVEDGLLSGFGIFPGLKPFPGSKRQSCFLPVSPSGLPFGVFTDKFFLPFSFQERVPFFFSCGLWNGPTFRLPWQQTVEKLHKLNSFFWIHGPPTKFFGRAQQPPCFSFASGLNQIVPRGFCVFFFFPKRIEISVL